MGGISLHLEMGLGTGTGVNAERPSPAAPPAVEQAAPPAAATQPLVVTQNELQASFTYDQALNRVVITLTREGTGEVIRQIPTEQMLRVLHGMIEMAGQTFDQKG